MTRNVTRSIVVNVPPEQAYGVWSDFENFPRFMAPIVHVRQEGRRLFWRAVFDGRAREWEAEVVELSPYRRVAWHGASGGHDHVVITMRPLDAAQTEVTLGAEYNATSGQHEQRAVRFEEYLRAFKDLVECLAPGELADRLPETPGEYT